MSNWLVLYDISDPKKLNYVSKTLSNYGKRVQKSVFEVDADLKTINYIRSKINSNIELSDIVCYFKLCINDWNSKEKYGPEEFRDELLSDFYIY